jgi:hypothetical protein
VIRVAASILLRLAGCVLFAWAVADWLGKVAMITILPIFGIALARPLIDLASEIGAAMRRAYWRDVEGSHFAFRGQPVGVVTDADRRRWVRLADIRAVAGSTAGDAALALSYPDSVSRFGRAAEPHLDAEALLAHLRKERSPEAVRFARWVKREIVFPARRERERLGIRTEVAGFRASD